MTTITVRRALLSVSDKTGLVDFARALAARGVELLASGGTARALLDAGCAVTEVAHYTGSPEILDGRVKTLHPKIHAGILARRNVAADMAQLAQAGWEPIDLVVVNLYPFRETVGRAYGTWPAGATELLPDIIENIDIGGPSLLRGAAKNFAHVLTVCDPADYLRVLAALQPAEGAGLPMLAQQLAAKVFAHVAQYDATIAQYFSQATDDVPAIDLIPLQPSRPLRYGENPHQAARWHPLLTPPWIGTPLQGKALSYNNLLDADAAVQLASELFEYPYAAAIIKHGNPCGVGISASSLAEAVQRAFDADSLSAFGGIVVVTRPLDGETAAQLATHFFEVILAPDFSPAARQPFAAKTNLRLVPCTLPVPSADTVRSACGGVLVQAADEDLPAPSAWRCATSKSPTAAETAALELAWRVCKHVRSNAIVLCSDVATVGIGAGQMSRVDAVEMAVKKSAGRNALAAASDAFFPFPDGIEALQPSGVRAVVQPGGAKRDADVLAAAERLGMAMLLTGTRHFRH